MEKIESGILLKHFNELLMFDNIFTIECVTSLVNIYVHDNSGCL